MINIGVIRYFSKKIKNKIKPEVHVNPNYVRTNINSNNNKVINEENSLTNKLDYLESLNKNIPKYVPSCFILVNIPQYFAIYNLLSGIDNIINGGFTYYIGSTCFINYLISIYTIVNIITDKKYIFDFNKDEITDTKKSLILPFTFKFASLAPLILTQLIENKFTILGVNLLM